MFVKIILNSAEPGPKPLTSHEVILDELRSTTTSSGLQVEITLIESIYEKDLAVTNEEMELLTIKNTASVPD